MERMYPDPHMERILPRGLRDVLVRANARSFQSLARELFVLVRHKVAAEWEIVDGRPFTAQVEYPDLGDC